MCKQHQAAVLFTGEGESSGSQDLAVDLGPSGCQSSLAGNSVALCRTGMACFIAFL